MNLDQLLHLPIVTGGKDKELRLTGGENKCSGRVEVKVQEEWGTVCNNGWDMDVVLLFVGSWDVQLLSKPLDGLILVQVLDAFGWIMFLVEGMSQLSGTANMMDGESITVLTNRMLE